MKNKDLFAEAILYSQLEQASREYERAIKPILEKLYKIKSASTPQPMFIKYDQAEKRSIPSCLTPSTEEV